MIKHLILLKIRNMMDINADLLQWFMTFLIKKLHSGIKKGYISSKELPEKSHKTIIRKFKKTKLHSPFIDNV